MRLASAEHTTRKPTPTEAVALLKNGARMDQVTFHEIYLLTPPKFKAELIGGTVHVMSSPLYVRHGRPHLRVCLWLGNYIEATPGTDGMDNTTCVLSEACEPQPDACLIITPQCGGKASVGDFLSGPVDLVVEVANSSREIDLGAKKTDDETAGIREYVVVLAKERTVRWFRRGKAGYKEVSADNDGIFRSTIFPGLWLDPVGLFAETTRPLTSALKQGLASPEHKAFIAKLKAHQTKPKRKVK